MYLGHVVNGECVSMDKDKVKAVLEWPTPQKIKQLRGFLSLTGYYRRFIKSYANLAAPLMNLLKRIVMSRTGKQILLFRN